MTPLDIARRRASQMRHLVDQHLLLIEHLESEGDALPVEEARTMLPRMQNLLRLFEEEAAAEAAKGANGELREEARVSESREPAVQDR